MSPSRGHCLSLFFLLYYLSPMSLIKLLLVSATKWTRIVVLFSLSRVHVLFGTVRCRWYNVGKMLTKAVHTSEEWNL